MAVSGDTLEHPSEENKVGITGDTKENEVGITGDVRDTAEHLTPHRMGQHPQVIVFQSGINVQWVGNPAQE